MTTQSYHIVTHKTIAVPFSFDVFTGQLESQLGLFEPVLTEGGNAPPFTLQQLLSDKDCTNLLAFNIVEHGEKRKTRLYDIAPGLPDKAFGRNDITRLYTTVRILVYELDSQTTCVDFDLPSSQMRQLGDPQISAASKRLDAALLQLLGECELQCSR